MTLGESRDEPMSRGVISSHDSQLGFLAHSLFEYGKLTSLTSFHGAKQNGFPWKPEFDVRADASEFGSTDQSNLFVSTKLKCSRLGSHFVLSFSDDSIDSTLIP